jgi:LacI family transcriptional regulator
MERALEAVYRLGYRRPGLIIARQSSIRSADKYISAYLGWCFQKFGTPLPLPLLQGDEITEPAVARWLERHRPDVAVAVHFRDRLVALGALLQRRGIRCPKDLGIIAISDALEGLNLSGLQTNDRLIGAWAVELLVDRIYHRDFGIPRSPRIQLVDSEWVTGKSLRLSLG